MSVIVPCFNDGEYIEDAINSVLNQTYKEIEIIICDDGSNDKNTLNLLRKFENKGIKVIYQSNQGPSAARNNAISHSSGVYILPLDADDKIGSTYIEDAVAVLDEKPNIGIVYCKGMFFGKRNTTWDLPPYNLLSMLTGNIIFVSALFRKSDWKKVGGFCTEFKIGLEDYDFWLSILELGREVYQIPKRLFYYRKKSTSRSLQFDSNIDSVKAAYRLLYVRHSKLYEMHSDEYCIVLREEIIKLNFYIARLEQVTGIKLIKDIFNRFRVLGILKNFIKNRLLKND
ncbi:glycosyltransferase [Phocaeicola sp.]|uniref:glycosyltransferase n=1 Tax=Phocaeicola sp. TaxID=2773926 RepID=UPI003AB5C629